MYVRVCMCMCVYLCVFVCLGVCSVVHGCCSRCCSRYCSRLLDRERCECDDVTGSRGERGMIACASGQCIGGGVRGGGGDELSGRAVCLRVAECRFFCFYHDGVPPGRRWRRALIDWSICFYNLAHISVPTSGLHHHSKLNICLEWYNGRLLQSLF